MLFIDRASAMGMVCARCSEVKKGKGSSVEGQLLPPEVEESESSADGSESESEIAASSEEDGTDHEEYRQRVDEILKDTKKNLRRGKTMAMREAIATAKKEGIETSKISDAERALDDHKRQQRREEAEKQVDAFFKSAASKDMGRYEKMIKMAEEAECRPEFIQRLAESLAELMLTRSLEEEEIQRARRYLKQSCRDFVVAATKEGGRHITLLNLEGGQRKQASLLLDPPLQNLVVVEDNTDKSSATEVPLTSMTAMCAKDDKIVRNSRGFCDLEESDCECAVALRYEVGDDDVPGIFCFLESSQVKRDRLIEAVVVLATACS